MPQYVVYDTVDQKFDVVAYLSKKCDGHRQVGFLNEKEDDFVKKHELNLDMGRVTNCAGYPWLINDVNLLNDMANGKSVDTKYAKLAQEMNATIDPDAWNEVETKEDAENMMYHVGGFHDWYFIGLQAIANQYDCEIPATVQLKFSSQAAFDTLVEFEHPYIKYAFAPINRVYLSSVVIDGDLKYWVEGDENIKPQDVKKFGFVCGKKMRWKFVVKEEEW